MFINTIVAVATITAPHTIVTGIARRAISAIVACVAVAARSAVVASGAPYTTNTVAAASTVTTVRTVGAISAVIAAIAIVTAITISTVSAIVTIDITIIVCTRSLDSCLRGVSRAQVLRVQVIHQHLDLSCGLVGRYNACLCGLSLN